VWHYDEPFADASAIPTYYVSKLAREHVTVVLNGDGGDENFAGYDRYVANALARRLGPLAAVLGSSAVRRMIDLLPHGATSASGRWRLKRFLAPLGRTPEARNAAWQAQFDLESKQELYTGAFRRDAGRTDAEELLYARYREAGTEDFLDATLYTDVTGYLPDALLTKVDIASMAVALEARSPFLDHEFMEWSARLPSRRKMGGRCAASSRTTCWIAARWASTRRWISGSAGTSRTCRMTCCSRHALSIAATSSAGSWNACCANTTRVHATGTRRSGT
jgi:asparagine synthase (glutamine-hydrolysing)